MQDTGFILYFTSDWNSDLSECMYIVMAIKKSPHENIPVAPLVERDVSNTDVMGWIWDSFPIFHRVLHITHYVFI